METRSFAIVWEHLLPAVTGERSGEPLILIEIPATRRCEPAYYGEKVELLSRCSLVDVRGC